MTFLQSSKFKDQISNMHQFSNPNFLIFVVCVLSFADEGGVYA